MNEDNGWLLVASLTLPLAMLVAGLVPRWRRRLSAWLVVAPLPALAAALLAIDGAPLILDEARLQIALALGVPGAILLGVAALLWSAAGAYAWRYLRGDPHGGRFVVYWLLSLTGCLGVFIAADLVSFYLFFGLVSLAAYGLVIHDRTPRARRAAVVYIALAVFGEACLLLAFVLLAAATPGEGLLIRDAVAALPASPLRDQTLAFLLLGFGLKAGLIPLHLWLPLAHPAAPMPASAVLSGAIIKTGLFGLMIFLPFGAELPSWAWGLTALGLCTALYGALIGLFQSNPKTVLAYSSISQMGVATAILGMGLAVGEAAAVLVAVFYAAHHVLVKGALFLAIGVVAATGRQRIWPVLVPTAILALGLGGLPLTGGFLAKLVAKPWLDEGLVGLVATLSAVATTMLMVHFLRRLLASLAAEPSATAPRGLTLPWAGLAVAALVVPWALYGKALAVEPTEVLTMAYLLAAAGPLLAGLVLAVAVVRWENRLPRIPEGDIGVWGERVVRATFAWGGPLARLDAVLRQWTVAGLALLALALLLGMSMLGGP